MRHSSANCFLELHIPQIHTSILQFTTAQQKFMYIDLLFRTIIVLRPLLGKEIAKKIKKKRTEDSCYKKVMFKSLEKKKVGILHGKKKKNTENLIIQSP